jgi:hypothetical protein
MITANVTYDIITEESSEMGEAEEMGFISQEVSLRDAIKDLFTTRTCHVDGLSFIEANFDGSLLSCLSIRVGNGMEFLTGAHEQRTLHLNLPITPSSATRLTKLLGAT